MSYADFIGGNDGPYEAPANLPEEVRLHFGQFSEDLKGKIARGEIRFVIKEGETEGEGKTIYLIHDDPFGPERVAERLEQFLTDAKELMFPERRIARRTKRTKFDIQETIAPGVEPFRHEKPRTGRNERCPCGSGRKHKECCMGKKGT